MKRAEIIAVENGFLITMEMAPASPFQMMAPASYAPRRVVATTLAEALSVVSAFMSDASVPEVFGS